MHRLLTNEHVTLIQASGLVTAESSLIRGARHHVPHPIRSRLAAGLQRGTPDIQRLLVAKNSNVAQALVQVGPSSLEERAALIERLHTSIAMPRTNQTLQPSNASAPPFGRAITGIGLLINLTANRSALTIVALLLVGAWLVLRNRDAARAARTMSPVLLAVGASATLVSLLGITLSPLTTVGGPLVVATCGEFSALWTARYVEGRCAGLLPTGAQALASERAGRAFIASALTTIDGLAVVMFVALPLLRDLGTVVTLDVTVAVMSALVVVPPLAIWADQRDWFTAAATLPRRIDFGPRRLVAATVSLVLTAVAGGITGSTLPLGPAERPSARVASTFYDALAGGDVAAGVARCAADALVGTTSEANLIAMGIAKTLLPAGVDARVAQPHWHPVSHRTALTSLPQAEIDLTRCNRAGSNYSALRRARVRSRPTPALGCELVSGPVSAMI